MAVFRRQNWPSQIRADVPAMRAIESAASADFDMLFQSWVTGTGQGYVVRGFNVVMSNAIGNAASSLQVQVDPGALLHIAASQSGTQFLVPAGTPNQVLNSVTNSNVVGSFTPSSINYVTIDYTRFLDATTNVQGYFWDPSTNTEFTEFVPSAQILNFVINISTVTPTPNQLPIATILTDSSNLVVDITDARWMFCSLSTGGLSPDPFFTYPWTQGRTLTSPTTSSDSVNPFTGGDKSIGSLKELLNAIMSIIKEIKGTPFWFSQSSTSTFPYIYQNAALNALSGGTWVSPTLGHLQLHGGATLTRFGFQNQLVLSAFGPSLGPDSSANTATVTDNTNVAYTTAAATTTNIGDTVTIGSVTRIINSIVQTSPTLTVEVAEPGFTNGTGLSATLTHYASFNLSVDQTLYLLFSSTDIPITYGYGNDGSNPIVPQQVQFAGVSPTTILVPSGGNYVTNPLPGPNSGNILVNGQVFSYNTYSEGGGVGTFNGVSPNPVGQVSTGNYVYQLDNNNTGYYHASIPSAVPGTNGSFSLGAERVYWVAFYDGSSNIILREGSLAAGEAINVGDTLSTAILTYIGMPSSGTSYPTYSSNIRGAANENLTSRAGALTDAIGDEQEDRSAYFFSASQVSWNGTAVTFPSDVVLNIYNTKSGTPTSHTISSSTYNPVTLADGQMFYVSINRTATSETLTGTVASSLPAQTESTKDIIVVFQRRGTQMVMPLSKQMWQTGEARFIGDDSVYGSNWTFSQNLAYVSGSPGFVSFNDVNNVTGFLNYRAGTATLNSAIVIDPFNVSSGSISAVASSFTGTLSGTGTMINMDASAGVPVITGSGATTYVGGKLSALRSAGTGDTGTNASLYSVYTQLGNFSTNASAVTTLAVGHFIAYFRATGTVNTMVGFHTDGVSPGSGSVGQYVGLYSGATNGAANNAAISDTLTPAAGNWFIYQGSSTLSQLNGNLQMSRATSSSITNFTQGLTDAGFNIVQSYTSGQFWPGLFWSATNSFPALPKAGIFISANTSGSTMYFGTSDNYGVGITQQVSIDPTGNLTVPGTVFASALDVSTLTVGSITFTGGSTISDAGGNLLLDAGSGEVVLEGSSIQLFDSSAFNYASFANSGGDLLINSRVLAAAGVGVDLGPNQTLLTSDGADGLTINTPTGITWFNTAGAGIYSGNNNGSLGITYNRAGGSGSQLPIVVSAALSGAGMEILAGEIGLSGSNVVLLNGSGFAVSGTFNNFSVTFTPTSLAQLFFARIEPLNAAAGGVTTGIGASSASALSMCSIGSNTAGVWGIVVVGQRSA